MPMTASERRTFMGNRRNRVSGWFSKQLKSNIYLMAYGLGKVVTDTWDAWSSAPTPILSPMQLPPPPGLEVPFLLAARQRLVFQPW